MIAPLSTKMRLWYLSKWLCLGLLSALFLSPYTANACITSAEFEMGDIRNADAIFSGSVLSYEIISPESPDSIGNYGLITVRVRDSLKGNVSGDVKLYWWNSTFALPEELRLTDPALFAVVADRNSPPIRGGSATIFAGRRRELLSLLQAPCAAPFMLPYARRSAENVRKILAGYPVDYFDEFGPGQNLIYRTTPATHRTERAFSIVLLAGAIGLASLVIAALWIWLRKRRRAGVVAK